MKIRGEKGEGEEGRAEGLKLDYSSLAIHLATTGGKSYKLL